MKREELIIRIRRAARREGKDWRLQRQGGRHEIWRCGSIELPIPRHAEIKERLAERMFRRLEAELGEDWWRR